MPLFSSDLKVTLIPYQITGGKNFEQLSESVLNSLSQALEGSPDLIVLPELISFDLIPDDFDGDTKKILVEGAAYFDRYVEKVKNFSKEQEVHIMAGSFQRLVGDKLLNTSVMIFPDGEVLLQDKIFVTPWEKKYGLTNGRELHLFQINSIKTVILNCHDVEFPSVSEKLATHRPELIIVPSMTDDQFGYQRVARTSMARAIEHMSFIAQVGTRSVDEPNWHDYFGTGDIYSPQNPVLYEYEVRGNPESSKNVSGTISFGKLREYRESNSVIYPVRDQNSRKSQFLIIEHLKE